MHLLKKWVFGELPAAKFLIASSAEAERWNAIEMNGRTQAYTNSRSNPMDF